MIPNVNGSHDNKDSVLMKCNCGDAESIEISAWNWNDKDEPTDYVLGIVNYPATFWSAIGWWWKHRKVWVTDITLRKEDLRYLRDWLNSHITD